MLDIEPLDLFLIDGGHGFPHPTIDWYYGAGHLKDGGIVIVDDVQLPAVADYLIRFLDLDDRWDHVAGDHKWRAYRKRGDFSLGEEWTDQAFLGGARRSPMNRLKIAVHRQLTRLRR